MPGSILARHLEVMACMPVLLLSLRWRREAVVVVAVARQSLQWQQRAAAARQSLQWQQRAAAARQSLQWQQRVAAARQSLQQVVAAVQSDEHILPA
jgi:hypothetical protein